MTPERLTITEAAKRVQVSRRTIYNWITRGLLVVNRTAGGHVRIDETSLWQKIEAHTDRKAVKDV